MQWFHAQGAVTTNTADGSPRLVGVTENITERKRGQHHATFLAEISADLASLSTADEIMQVVGAKIGVHLGLSSCTFMDIDEAADEASVTHNWHRPDVKSLLGTYRIHEFVTGDFQRACRAGETFVVRDTVADPRTDAAGYAAIDVRAFVSVPVVRDGAWRFLLVMFDSAPHNWPEAEIELMREITARIWTRIERARNEEALRESEARLRAVFESAREFALITMDVEGRITGWNPGAEAIFDCSAAEMVGRDARELFSAEDRTARVLEAEMAQSAETGRAGKDRWMQGCHGRRFWASGSLMPLRVAGRPPHGFLKILRDMTGFHRSELARRDAEDRFALVVQSIQDYAIYMLDASGHITTWNQGAERIKGYTPAEAIGRPFSFCFTPEAIAEGKPAQELEIAAREGRFQEENWRMRGDGTRYWGDELIVALRAEDGELIAFAKFCRDLTNRKRYEDERTQLLAAEGAARAEAEAASKAKDHFLAVLSHELRTPLSPVLMAVHLIGRSQNLPKTARDALEMIERNVQIEAHLIDDLLDLTRITRGKLEIVRQTMDLHQAVAHAVEITVADTKGKNQQVTVALEAAEHELLGDTTRLQQVFWNLLKNASKFTPEGGSIHITSCNEPGRIIVEGCRHRHRLRGGGGHAHFRRVYPGEQRGHAEIRRPGSRTRDFQGYRRCPWRYLARPQRGPRPGRDFHRGTAAALENGDPVQLGPSRCLCPCLYPWQPGESLHALTFMAIIDKADGTGSVDSVTMIEQDFSEPERALRIFVVENHADTLKYLSLYLEAMGHSVVSAKTMTEALAALPLAGCDVLISDIGLPDGDGWTLLRTVQLPQPVYAIAMSGFGMNADHIKSRDAGYRQHLLKPVIPKELEAALLEAANEAVAPV